MEIKPNSLGCHQLAGILIECVIFRQLCIYRSYLNMRNFQIPNERYTHSHDERKLSFRSAI